MMYLVVSRAEGLHPALLTGPDFISEEGRAFFRVAEGRVLRVVRRSWNAVADLEVPAADGAVTYVGLMDDVSSRGHCDIWLQQGQVWVRQEPPPDPADAIVLNKETFASDLGELRPGAVLGVSDHSLVLRHLDPTWLVWNGGTVPQLARAIYDDDRFDDLPILADALEDAGCRDTGLLAHGRSAGPHSRRCWVLDLILGPAMAHSLPGQQKAIEKQHIQRVLCNSGYSRARAADALGISRVTLYRKLKKYGLVSSATPPQRPISAARAADALGISVTLYRKLKKYGLVSSATPPQRPISAAAVNVFNNECEGLCGV
jgi:DNA-binding protein Fis